MKMKKYSRTDQHAADSDRNSHRLRITAHRGSETEENPNRPALNPVTENYTCTRIDPLHEARAAGPRFRGGRRTAPGQRDCHQRRQERRTVAPIPSPQAAVTIRRRRAPAIAASSNG